MISERALSAVVRNKSAPGKLVWGNMQDYDCNNFICYKSQTEIGNYQLWNYIYVCNKILNLPRLSDYARGV